MFIDNEFLSRYKVRPKPKGNCRQMTEHLGLRNIDYVYMRGELIGEEFGNPSKGEMLNERNTYNRQQ